MSQSSLWSPSRGLWFTCLGCQVLPSPSLMQHGCPVNLFVSVPLVGLPWLWPSTGQPSRGGEYTHMDTCVDTHTYSSCRHTKKGCKYRCKCVGVLDPCRHTIHNTNLPTRTYMHTSFLSWVCWYVQPSPIVENVEHGAETISQLIENPCPQYESKSQLIV